MSKSAGNRTKALTICSCFALLFGAWAAPASGQIIAYWNFNDTSNLLTVSQGAGTMTHTFNPVNIVNFAGSLINAQGGDPAGSALALQGGTGLVNNGQYLIIAVDTSGSQNIVMSFASQRSGTGFNNNQVAYSTNGGSSWTDFGAPYDPPLAFALFTFDFSGITALENNPNVRFRIQFNGATSAAGNNRIDNLVIAGQGAATGPCCQLDGSCSLLSEAACTNAGGNWQGAGGSCSPNPCPQPTGACCNPDDGTCTPDLTRPECEGDGGIYKGNFTDCDPNPCVGACCDQGGSTCNIRTPQNCIGQVGGGIYRGDATTCEAETCDFNFDGILINEIRIDQPGTDTDEYFELVNISNETRDLSGLFYIVLRQTGTLLNSGRVKSVTDLTGFSIPPGGHFLVATGSFGLQGAVPDFVTSLIFENGENTTHMLVSGFFGQVGDVVDTDNNCQIDNPLWFQVIDKVALIRADNLPGGPSTLTGCHYGTGDPFIDTLKDGSFVPGHVFRCGTFPGSPCIDGSNFGFEDWFVGPFNPVFGDDTPGAPNQRSTGACCAVDSCLDGYERQVCVEAETGNWLGRDTTCMADGARCEGACCTCLDPPACESYTCTVGFPIPCTSTGGIFQGPLTTCPPEPNGVDCADCITIAEARALPLGSPVRLCSVIVSSKTNLINSASSNNFHIQDESGADGQSGLTIFGTATLIQDQFGGAIEGNRIGIQGQLGVFNGLLQLQDGANRALALVNIAGFEGVPAPVTVTAADFQNGSPTAEGYESEIIRLNCVVFEQTGNFAALTNYTVTDGTYSVVVRVSTLFQVDIVGQPIPTGPVNITGIFSQFDTSVGQNSGYQILLRTINDIQPGSTCGDTAACCLAGPSCRDDLTEDLCRGLGGLFRPDDQKCPPAEPCPDNTDVRITEIRITQPGNDLDEYFELSGVPGTPLGDLTYIVLGDGPQGQSGWIECVVPLASKSIPDDGYFLCTENTFTLRPLSEVDLVLVPNALNFENDDNVTHMLVKGFTGAIDDDLDPDNDGVLDITPWAQVVDKVAIIRQHNPPTTTEWHYGPPVVGPAGGTSPGHVALCPSNPPEWRVEAFDPAVGDDTPGEPNPAVCACAGCLGDLNVDGILDARDIQLFVNTITMGQGDGCADINLDGELDVDDIAPFVSRLLDKAVCGIPRASGVRVMTWNLLNYSGTAPSNRKTAYKRVLNHVRADIIVCQEVNNVAGANDFLTQVLNASDGPGGYAMAEFTDGPGSDQVLYYKTDKITYTNGNHTALATTPRPTGRWRVGVVGSPPNTDLYVYGMHLKAGSAMEDPSNPADREAAAAIIRADANALPAGSQIIYAGDMNLYTSAEGAWARFTESQMINIGQAFDPVNQPGNWSGNCAFAFYHTQSTYRDNAGSPAGAAGGGLDDRFDFMLITDSLRDGVGLSYLNSTYRAFGNDGNHCNMDINDPPVIPQGQFIADALLMASDHLPVIMDLGIFEPPAQ